MNLISAFSKDIWNNKDIYATYKFRETFQRSSIAGETRELEGSSEWNVK